MSQPEIAVATTKAYSTQLVLLDMLGLYFADIIGSVGKEDYARLVEELQTLPAKMEKVLENTEEIKYLASRYFNHSSVFYIGRNLDYALGLEGSLKLKEISYIASTGRRISRSILYLATTPTWYEEPQATIKIFFRPLMYASSRLSSSKHTRPSLRRGEMVLRTASGCSMISLNIKWA